MVELRYNADGKLEFRQKEFGQIFFDAWQIVPGVEKEDVAPIDNTLCTEQEAAAAPAANAGGVSNPEPIAGGGKSGEAGNQEPVLYGVLWEGRPRVESWDVRDTEEQAVRLADTDGTVIHLYAANAGGEQPQPPRGWLTRHERWRLGEMVAWLQGMAAEHPDTIHGGLCESYAADIDALLARSKPPRVKLPRYIHSHPQYGQVLREVSVAIREAGVEVVK